MLRAVILTLSLLGVAACQPGAGSYGATTAATAGSSY